MASEFIGYTILVSLKGTSPAQQLSGIVADVLEQQLVLKDVTLLWNGQYLPLYQIDSSAIADLEVVSYHQKFSPSTTFHRPEGVENIRPNHEKHGEYSPPHKSAPESFVDPAILSFTKPQIVARNISADTHPSQQLRPDLVSPVMIADSSKQSPINARLHETNFPSPHTARSNAVPTMSAVEAQKRRDRRDSTATATLTAPFDHMALTEEDTTLTGTVPEETSVSRGIARKNRRRATRKGKDALPQAATGIANPKNMESPQTAVKRSPVKGKGWRQTPLVEEAIPANSEPKPRRSGHQSRKNIVEDTTGWATEDATDIQDLGEFDFEHNLSKFDKRRVFDDIRKDDSTLDNDRLVSFNRKTRPGTNGGRNLHITEMVLDLPYPKANTWKSEAGETEEDEVVEEHYSSGRNSRRNGSWRPPPPSKGTFPPAKASATASSPLNDAVSSSRASLRLASNNKPCTCVSPLQMLEIEQLCTSELGLTDEILSENAGRGIAEAALNLPSDRSVNPIILFLVGNHKSGSRAVAAARHLRQRNIRVSVCVLGGERESMLLEGVKRQLDIYRRSGGWTVRWDELQSKLSAAADPLPELVVDALLGMHVTFSELRTDDQAIAFEMIRWANRSAIPILAVDVPSGLQASSGEVTVVDSGSLIIHALFVACLGAPKSGLLVALGTGDGRSHDWKLSVLDIGISNVAWKKYGTRRRHGVDFGREWVVDLKFVGRAGGVSGLDGV